MAEHTICAVRHRPLDIALIEPFGIATGSQTTAHNVLVAVELAGGTIGWGEAAPFAAVTGETQASTQAALERLTPLLIGEDVRSWRSLAAKLRVAEPQAAGARCALEAALLDALCKRAGLPLWAFFGGAGTALETDMTITTGSTEHAVRSALAIKARGITTIKIKIGGAPGIDLDRIAAVHAAVPTAPLILDGNCGYSVANACALLDELQQRAIPIVLFEQPTERHDWAGLKQVTHWSAVPVAADETVTTTADALRAVREDTVTCVNIKLMKAGIVEALDIAAICRAAGIQLMIGGMVESILAMTISAHFAAGLGGFRFVDLDTPMFMAAQPFSGGFQRNGAHLSVAHVTAGHGVVPRTETEG